MQINKMVKGCEMDKKLIANSTIVLREEFDDWAILFDPDTSNAFGLNPIGVFIWKLLNGKHTQRDILRKLRESYEDVPKEASSQVDGFIKGLLENGLAGYEAKTN